MSAPCEWYLRISKDTFNILYDGLDVDIELFQTLPTSSAEFTQRYLPSKLWRLNNIHTIVGKHGRKQRFVMNYAQHITHAAVLRHPRAIVLKSRQQGISTLWLISFVDDCLTTPNLTAGLMAQGIDEASTLLEKVKLDWDSLEPFVKNCLAIDLEADNSKTLKWDNGSMLFIRTSFRSTTLQRLHISEFAKIALKTPKRATETKTGSLQALAPGNICVIESTAEGKTMFTDEWNKAVGNQARIEQGKAPAYTAKQFQPVFLPWYNDPDCTLSLEVDKPESAVQTEYFRTMQRKCDVTLTQQQKNYWLEQYEEFHDAIYQEYPATAQEAFLKVRDGSYYGKYFNDLVVARGRVVANLFDPALPVDVVMDLGMDDTFVLLFYQHWKGVDRLIDEYTNSGEGIEHYANIIHNTGYEIGRVICPGDIEVRELNHNKTRRARLRDCGITDITIAPRVSLLNGIEQVRRSLSSLYVDEKCTYALECFTNYSKAWDEKHEMWSEKPVKSIYNHGADCFRYRAITSLDFIEKPKTKQEQEYDYKPFAGTAKSGYAL